MSLARHSWLNIAGALVPMLVAVPAMAFLARRLGLEGFGLVTLAWALAGYAAVFDLGVSRSVVRLVAEARDDAVTHRDILTNAVIISALLGVTVALVVVWATVESRIGWMGVSDAAATDASVGFLFVAGSVPLLLVTLALQGYWDGVQDFVEANLQRAIGGSAVPVLTAVGTFIESTFVGAMAGLFAARVVVLMLVLLRQQMHRQLAIGVARRATASRMLRFGGWLTVSNTISPIMGYLDRFILSHVAGAGQVGLYSGPAEIALRLLVLPVAVTRSLFPKIVGNNDKALVCQSYKLIAVISLPIGVACAAVAPQLLGAWLGPAFATTAADALRILMIGFVFGALAQVPFTQLHARGRSDVTAAIHVLELMPFLTGAYFACSAWGVVGAAIAWSLRCGVDLVLLYAAAYHFPQAKH